MALAVAMVWKQRELLKGLLCCQHHVGGVLGGGGEPEHTWTGSVCDLYHHAQHCVVGKPEHTWTWSVRDLCHHAQHFYSTTLSHTANCCGSDKLIRTVSCISHNISHPPCCQLAQVVALSIPPFNVKLSGLLPSSCNAAPLIAKATTQLKEVAFRQPITHYQILRCYGVSRSGLLNGEWPRELVRVDRGMLRAVVKLGAVFSISRPLTFSGVLIICILNTK